MYFGIVRQVMVRTRLHIAAAIRRTTIMGSKGTSVQLQVSRDVYLGF